MSDERANILVVDDDPNLLELLVDTLTAIGYPCTPAAGGVEALEILSDQTFDLMITDIKMPDVDGLQLLKKVRRHYPDMPVLFITGVASRDIIGQAAPDGFLAKPFRISQMEELIQEALAGDKTVYATQYRPRVLVVDTDEATRRRISEVLAGRDYLPFAVAHADAALREVENGSIDAVVTAQELSDSDGLSLLRDIRARYPKIATVLTGRKVILKRLETEHAGAADALLPRPLDPELLLSTLGKHGIRPAAGVRESNS